MVEFGDVPTVEPVSGKLFGDYLTTEELPTGSGPPIGDGPLGLVALNRVTSTPSTGGQNSFDVPEMAQTVSLTAGRLYAIHVNLALTPSGTITVPFQWSIDIKDGLGGQLRVALSPDFYTFGGIGFKVWGIGHYVPVSSGSHTFTPRVNRISGTPGAFSLSNAVATAADPAALAIEDLGPASGSSGTGTARGAVSNVISLAGTVSVANQAYRLPVYLAAGRRYKLCWFIDWSHTLAASTAWSGRLGVISTGVAGTTWLNYVAEKSPNATSGTQAGIWSGCYPFYAHATLDAAKEYVLELTSTGMTTTIASGSSFWAEDVGP